MPFTRELGPTIKANVSLSTISADNGYATFSCAAVICSQTLRQMSAASDPWMGRSAKPLFEGFEPCLVFHLAHLKWCEREDSVNPGWAMSLGHDTSKPNIHVWAADFERLFTPLLNGLTTDASLEAAMTRALAKAKPAWVKSDPPGFVFLAERLARLKTQNLPR